MNVIKDIINELGYESVTDTPPNWCLEINVDGWMKLVIERLPDDELSVAHYYSQHGDAMRDPEIVFDVSTDEWVAIEYRQDPTIHRRDENGIPDTTEFSKEWSDNLRQQGFLSRVKNADMDTDEETSGIKKC